MLVDYLEMGIDPLAAIRAFAHTGKGTALPCGTERVALEYFK